MAVEAVVLHKVTTNVPSTSVLFDDNWKHLSNLQLVDPDFGTPEHRLNPGCQCVQAGRLWPAVRATRITFHVQDGFQMGLGWYH